MSNISRIIPYSELIEKAQTLARDNSYSSRDKFKGLINWAYTQEIPRKEDWTPLIGSSTISCTAKYTTGTVSVTAGDTSITGVGTTWVTGMTNRKCVLVVTLIYTHLPMYQEQQGPYHLLLVVTQMLRVQVMSCLMMIIHLPVILTVSSQEVHSTNIVVVGLMW